MISRDRFEALVVRGSILAQPNSPAVWKVGKFMTNSFAKRFERRCRASAGKKGGNRKSMFESGQINFLACWVRRMIPIFPIQRMMGVIPSTEIAHVSSQAQGGGLSETGCEEKSQKLADGRVLTLWGGLPPSIPGLNNGCLRLDVSQIGGRELEAGPADRLLGYRRNQLKINWLPRMDSNHDKVIQNHLCYRYTTRQYFMAELELTGKVLTGFPSSGLPPVALGGSGYRPRN